MPRLISFKQASILGLLVLSALIVAWLFSLDNTTRTQLSYLLEDIRAGDTPPFKNLMLGSSSILRMPALSSCGEWTNRGLPNSWIEDVNSYLDINTLKGAPSRILLYMGENDLAQGLELEETTFEFVSLLAQLEKRYPDSKIHILPIKLSPSRKQFWPLFIEFNKQSKQMADSKENISFHPIGELEDPLAINDGYFVEDGIHLSKRGYQLFLKHFQKSCHG